MAMEIERKFLVRGELLPPLQGGRDILQGYLCECPQVRFRIAADGAELTVKQEVETGRRHEFEFFSRRNLSGEEARQLAAMALWPPLRKTRFRIPFGGLVWEVDVYQDENAGLVTADVELPSADCPIDFPPWIDSSADITGEARYANICLTRMPFKRWGGFSANEK